MDRQVQDDPRSAIRFETGTKDRADMRQPQPISTPVNPGPTPVAVPMAVVNTADAESVSPELDKVDIAHQQSEARVAQSSVAASNSAHRTEIAQALLRQITSGLAQAQDGRVEIRLEPEELGRLRMQIVPVDQGVTVHVSADRQETLDLLRRNIEQLARELRELGYQQTSFSFDGQGNGGQQSFDEQAGHAPRTADRTEPHTETANPARNIAPQDGLDLRL
ncbi:MAG: flagellar hook-length control protein FliK [Paracoccaceae bacterium]|nr:flagellar hook-length control protein FliK [Paracoccaceae bacterium]